MDELSRMELMALIGEQQILLAQAQKTIRRLEDAIARLKKPTPPEPKE
jgi:hypothetical protein